MPQGRDPHVLRVPTARAVAEREARQELSPTEYEHLHVLIPEVGLEGAPFDDASWVYPLEVPARPRVIVLSEDPRRVSVGLLNDRRQFVGVVGDAVFEDACVGHPGALVYAVGNITERTKDGRVYLNLRPRGWVRVEIEIEDVVVPKRGRPRRQ